MTLEQRIEISDRFHIMMAELADYERARKEYQEAVFASCDYQVGDTLQDPQGNRFLVERLYLIGTFVSSLETPSVGAVVRKICKNGALASRTKRMRPVDVSTCRVVRTES